MLELPTQDFIVSTGYLKVATPELVALDVLEYPNHAGGLNHIATVFSELIEVLDPIKLINLAKDTSTRHQLQRIGYILDHIDVMDEPGASKSLKSSVLSWSAINLSVADSNLGKSTSGGMLIFSFGDRNIFSSGRAEKRSAPWRASSLTPSK